MLEILEYLIEHYDPRHPAVLGVAWQVLHEYGLAPEWLEDIASECGWDKMLAEIEYQARLGNQ